MCGIFGISVGTQARFTRADLEDSLKHLFLLSESRGKEAAGLAAIAGDEIRVLKSATAASYLIRTQAYRNLVSQTLAGGARTNGSAIGQSATFIGHSRLVTTGTAYSPQNNQPVIAGHSVGIHNGIVVNHDEIWGRYAKLERGCDVDTEVILALIRMFYEETGSLIEATQRTFREIKGAASIAVLFEDFNLLLLATNNGSLYRCVNTANNAMIFASERFILSQLVRRGHVRGPLGAHRILHVPPGHGCIINTQDLRVQDFTLEGKTDLRAEPVVAAPRRKIVELEGVEKGSRSQTTAMKQVGITERPDDATAEYLEGIKKRFPHDTSRQDNLRRCTKCILPETMPFMDFDDDGVCAYCRNYQKIECRGVEQLERIVAPHRNTSSEPDCVVGVSGGRDSIYSLHYVKNILGMNPIAYTYDWAMVTDLARRNISRICGKLGIEHVIVSADITQKRKYIRDNVRAWLRKPALGMIPLFMAGDKQYFYYLQQVQKQVGVELAILGENMLERTHFKTGFAGVPPFTADASHVYTIPLASKMRMLSYYGWQYLSNPGYINQSLLDTLFAAGCYYLIDRSYVNLYNYVPWLEEEVVPTILNEYDFELSADTKTTWRIGDGTAAFYNYIYYNVAGFTENDTFRSNQIREGLIPREEALAQVRKENEPRLETIYWYLGIIEMDLPMHKVLEIIHQMPKQTKTS
jgi:glutamine---fructose-6-phosphate transaminase (isomerizing)